MSVPLDCYRVTVCEAVIVDAQRQTLSLIHVVERVTAQAEALGENFPLKAVFDATGDGEYEIRSMWFGSDGSSFPASDGTESLKLEGAFSRISMPAVRLPKLAGTYRLVLEWRPAGASEEHWRRSYGNAPVQFVLAQPAQAARPEEVAQA